MQDDDKDRLREAAIQAEFETGKREATAAKALKHAIVRVARMTAATIIIIIGVILLPLPGPGWVVIAAGFALLAKDVAWADRVVQRIRRRLPQDDDGKIPRSSIVTMIVFSLAAMALALWWQFGR
ncbi:MAG: hypothetical protein ACI91O_000838 [Candidatus Poriferisodalaceae bacterium]|jgi:uncharacterized protein (TIGR02611 family)